MSEIAYKPGDTMKRNDLLAVMQAIGEVNRVAGVAQRGGKRYTMVQDRVLEWRKVFGCQHGVSTAIIKDDGNIVQVQATITDDQGRVLGSGLAEEVRGSSAVNKTSALENCETSALGRALASLGLHGGEYASENEMDKVRRHSTAAAPEVVKPPTVTSDEIPLDETDATTDWSAWVAEQIAGFAKHRNVAEHKQWSSTVREWRGRLAREDADLHRYLSEKYVARRRELANNVPRPI
jgi:hypothetical protein